MSASSSLAIRKRDSAYGAGTRCHLRRGRRTKICVFMHCLFHMRVPIQPDWVCTNVLATYFAKDMVGVVSKGRGSTGACGFDVSFPCSVRARSSCGVRRSGMGRGCTAAAMCQPSFCPVPVACVSSFRYSSAVVTRCRGNDPPASCLLRARVLSIALAVACLFAGYVARVPCTFRARGFALRGRAAPVLLLGAIYFLGYLL